MATTKLSFDQGDEKHFGSTGITKAVGGAITAAVEVTYDASLITRSELYRALEDIADAVQGNDFS